MTSRMIRGFSSTKHVIYEVGGWRVIPAGTPMRLRRGQKLVLARRVMRMEIVVVEGCG